ncbi:hypothetical protein E2C01_065236 [Portunus trituberculatus]|uniref:Uncharacterized protein n=1 Tax=Portunus trituberculatus TaxID=210409 RepID=A0A5B7HF33_PORTR|nr:hypothetical protein [Portunus trituberculatus]
MFEAISELHDEINELKKDKDKSAYNKQQGMLGADAAPRGREGSQDKVPMTRYLFGDDVSQSARQTEESEKLRNKIAPKKSFSSWKSATGKFSGTKARRFLGRNPYRGFSTRFHSYGHRRVGFTRQSFSRQENEPKNTRGWGHSNPRQ